GKNVLVIEDIIDSGLTLKKILKLLGGRGPKKVSLCTLLDKKERREVEIDVQYVGFEIPNEFVLGYGLDFKEEYRNIPYVALAAEELYK
ncbi:MAG: hypoxanthine phosphoribosyltransferase, partial [Pseudoleptotrichia goodfellowii]|nr:hypoxanthine phosphoribosyltransferase [Pseudoleptotrichia goodfellowii]